MDRKFAAGYAHGDAAPQDGTNTEQQHHSWLERRYVCDQKICLGQSVDGGCPIFDRLDRLQYWDLDRLFLKFPKEQFFEAKSGQDVSSLPYQLRRRVFSG